MTERIIDIADNAVRLRVRHGSLSLTPDGGDEQIIPFREIGAVVLAHPRCTVSKSVLSALAEHGVAVITCNDRNMPVGMMLPLTGHHTSAERFIAQAEVSKPTRKRLWKQIIRAKVRAQGSVLRSVRGDDFGLFQRAEEVRSGDTANVEGQASRTYWPALFNDIEFLRRREKDDQNRYLNYGYAVLRAVTARAICGSGLHPCLGIHHHNRYNPFCLADDLMEPFRPSVDKIVVDIVASFGSDCEIDKDLKRELFGIFAERFMVMGESRSLFETLTRLTSSLADVFLGKRKDLILPKF